MNAIFTPKFPVSSQFNFMPLDANTFAGQHWYEVSDLTESTAVIGAGDMNFLVTYEMNWDLPEITDVSAILTVKGMDVPFDITQSILDVNNRPLFFYLSESLTDAVKKEQKRLAKQSEPDYDFMNDDLWPKRTDVKPCPSFAHLQSHKS